ncbi:hypothetical protein D3C81_1588390 [compost metagenome]
MPMTCIEEAQRYGRNFVGQLQIAFLLQADTGFQPMRPEQLAFTFHGDDVLKVLRAGLLAAFGGQCQQAEGMLTMGATLFRAGFCQLPVSAPMAAGILFSQIVRSLTPAFHIHRMRAERAQLVGILRVYKTGPNTGR